MRTSEAAIARDRERSKQRYRDRNAVRAIGGETHACDPTAPTDDVVKRMALLTRYRLLFKVKKIARSYHATVEEILSDSRTHRVVTARGKVIVALRSIYRDGKPLFSIPDIGLLIGRDQSSVMAALRQHGPVVPHDASAEDVEAAE